MGGPWGPSAVTLRETDRKPESELFEEDGNLYKEPLVRFHAAVSTNWGSFSGQGPTTWGLY